MKMMTSLAAVALLALSPAVFAQSSSQQSERLPGKAPATETGSRLSGIGILTTGGEAEEYGCNGYVCYCKGAYDCVVLISADAKCDLSTVLCNDDICVCSVDGTVN